MPRIVLHNHEASGIANTELADIADAIARYVQDDFLPAYRGNVTLQITCAHLIDPRPDDWIVAIDPDATCSSSIPGWSAFHGVRNGGIPYGAVVPRMLMRPISVMLSHEVLEMIAAPYANTGVRCVDGVDRKFEVVDPVCFDDVQLAGIRLCSFVTPAWWKGGPGPYDRLGKLTRPCQLAPGGFIEARRPDGTTYVEHVPLPVRPVREDEARDTANQRELEKILGRQRVG